MLHLTQKIAVGEKELHSFLHSRNTLMGQLHDHDFYEFALISQGSVTHMINGGEQLLSAGSVHFVYPSDAHFYINASADLVMLNITVRADIADALMSFLNVRLNKCIYAGSAFCAEVIEGWKKSPSATKEQLLKIAGALADEDGSAVIPDWLKATHKALDEDCNFADGTSFAVTYSGRSAEHLSREFKKHYGITLIEYITRLRLSYSKKLLTKTDMSVTDIAIKCGYYSVSHFNHIFLERFSLAPREYRNKFTVRV